MAQAAVERRRYWLSLAALLVALPAAIAIHSRGAVVDWLRAAMREPIVVERGVAHLYAGADWRLTGLTPLRGVLPDTRIIVAEFEASVDDPARLAGSPCEVVLTDEQGRRWEPPFTAGSMIREAMPEAADKPRCGFFEDLLPGTTVEMAESFVVPEDARGLALSILIFSAAPDRLLFR